MFSIGYMSVHKFSTVSRKVLGIHCVNSRLVADGVRCGRETLSIIYRVDLVRQHNLDNTVTAVHMFPFVLRFFVCLFPQDTRHIITEPSRSA